MCAAQPVGDPDAKVVFKLPGWVQVHEGRQTPPTRSQRAATRVCPHLTDGNGVAMKDHEWIALDGGKVGITDFAQKELGDIVFVDLPEARPSNLPCQADPEALGFVPRLRLGRK